MSRRVVLAICLLVCPFAVTEAMLVWRLHSTLGVCDAVVMDDECHYWNEIATYQDVGFRGGYFVDAERPAPARWSHFGPHGPAFPVLYGSLARVFGWDAATGPLFNLGVLAAGMLAWLALVRPDVRSLAAVLFVLATFWPCPIYLPATLQETLHQAIAFVLAGLAHRAVNGSDSGARSFWPFILVTAAAAIFRVTWSLVLVPWAVIALQRGGRWTRVLVPAVCLAAIALLIAASRQLSAPYPNFLAAVFEIAGHSPAEQLNLLSGHAGFSFYELFLFHDRPLEALQRYQVVALIVLSAVAVLRPDGTGAGLRLAAAVVVACVALVLLQVEVPAGVLLTLAAVWRGRRLDRPGVVLGSVSLCGGLYVLHNDVLIAVQLGPYGLVALKVVLTGALLWLNRDAVKYVLLGLAHVLGLQDCRRPYLFVGLNLGLLLLAVVTLYDVLDWRDYRVVAPHLLLSLLMMAAGTARRWAVRVALVNLLFAPLFAPQFETSHRIRVDAKRTAEVVIDLRPYLVYDSAADSPWANTVLVPEVDLSNRVRVPAGVGVCWVVPFSGGGRLTLPADSPYFVAIQQVGADWLVLPPKSRYVFAAPGTVSRWPGCHLRLLKELRQGNLYRNLDEEKAPGRVLRPTQNGS
jgi:hypothetical protein